MNRSLAALLGSICVIAALCCGCDSTSENLYRSDNQQETCVETEPTETMPVTGWVEVENGSSYLLSDGTMATGWLELEEGRYYLGLDGIVCKGILELDDQLWLLDSQGILSSGWVKLDGKWYYGDQDGHPVQGWLELDGVRYYMDENCSMHTGWLSLDGFTYYFNEDGSPAQGQMDIDGQTCYFAFNGQQIILTNPWNSVPEDYTVNLVSLDYGHQVADIAYDDLQEMFDACRAAGYAPAICSSYRTVEYQSGLFRKKMNYYLEQGYDKSSAYTKAATMVAVPGTSEHHLGLALDIVHNSNWNLDESQARTPTQKWLIANSWQYGWILRYPEGTQASTGIVYEPWHYRYVGKEVAADIYNSGLCLEDYLAMLTTQ